MRVAALLGAVMLVATCGGGRASFVRAQKRATDKNLAAHDKQRDKALLDADGAVFVPLVAVVELNQEALPTGGIVGLRPGEGLYSMADGELALMPKTCIRGNACGCEVGREYTYLKTPEGMVVVTRLTPVVSLREIKTEQCSAGCGTTPPPPALRSAARLGVKEVAKIRFVEATYPYELVVEKCDHPVPAP